MLKKSIQIATLVLVGTQLATAQINSTSIGVAGDSIFNGRDNDVGTGAQIVPASLGTTGANQTWYFQGIDLAGKDTVTFVDLTPAQIAAVGGNLGLKFSKATSALSGLGNSTAFNAPATAALNKTASILEIQGVFTAFQGLPMTLKFDNPQTVMTFPSDIGTTFNDTYSFDSKPLFVGPLFLNIVDSVRVQRIASGSSVIVSKGQLKLPNGLVINDVYRQDYTEIVTDTIRVYSRTGYSQSGITVPAGWSIPNATAAALAGLQGGAYTDTLKVTRFVAEGGKYFLTTIAYKNDNVIPQSASYVLKSAISGVNDFYNNPAFTFYPNPTQDELTVSLQNKLIETLNVYDLTGKLVLSKAVQADQTSLHLGHLENGFYMVEVLDQNSSRIATTKIQVQK